MHALPVWRTGPFATALGASAVLRPLISARRGSPAVGRSVGRPVSRAYTLASWWFEETERGGGGRGVRTNRPKFSVHHGVVPRAPEKQNTASRLRRRQLAMPEPAVRRRGVVGPAISAMGTPNCRSLSPAEVEEGVLNGQLWPLRFSSPMAVALYHCKCRCGGGGAQEESMARPIGH